MSDPTHRPGCLSKHDPDLTICTKIRINTTCFTCHEPIDLGGAGHYYGVVKNVVRWTCPKCGPKEMQR